MKAKAYAKINLGLNVIGKKENGYHLLDMVMAKIDLYDEIELDIHTHYQLECNDETVPVDTSNIVYQCIEAMRQAYSFKEQFKIKINKSIPSQAGLAGGSSDGACVMHMVNELLHLQLTTAQLQNLGEKIGADIPFCLQDQVSRVQGIGEVVMPLKQACPFNVIVVKPSAGINTKMLFQNLTLDTIVHPNIDQMVDDIEKGHYPIQLGNSLQALAITYVPEIENIVNQLLQFGCDSAIMSGSGSSVVGISKNRPILEKIKKFYENEKTFCKIANIL